MEYNFVKNKFDAGELVKEIENTTGLILTGINQQGYIETAGNKIKIILKSGTTLNENLVKQIILNHKLKNPKVKKDKITALKQKLNLTDEEWDLIK